MACGYPPLRSGGETLFRFLVNQIAFFLLLFNLALLLALVSSSVLLHLLRFSFHNTGSALWAWFATKLTP